MLRPLRLAKLLVLSILTTSAAAAAQEFPTRPISLVVPFAPGGFVHTVALLVGEQMGRSLGQNVVIMNRPGANGNLAAEAVAKSDPDGYTIFLPTSSILTINPHLYRNIAFDPLSDFASVGLITYTSNVFVVSPRSGMRSFKDLVSQARKPGGLSYGSSGTGSVQHISGELLRTQLGADVVHVSYKGVAPALVDLIGDRLGFVFSDASVLQHVKAGRLTAIAISPRSLDDLPGIPALSDAAREAGLPDYAPPTLWYGLVAPKATPPAILARLNAALVDTVLRPEVRARLLADGASPADDPSSARFAEVIRADHARYRTMLQTLGIKGD